MRRAKLILFLIFIIIGVHRVLGAASGHGAGHDSSIPFRTILFQAINVAILFYGIYYYTHSKVREAFLMRRKSYEESFLKTKKAREEAERNFSDIKSKLSLLKENKGSDILEAEELALKQAEKLKKEAHEVAARVKTEADQAIELEFTKAKEQLRIQLIRESIARGKELLGRDIGAADHQQLQFGFNHNIQDIKHEVSRNF